MSGALTHHAVDDDGRVTTGDLDDYELLDCGDGARLERFGPLTVDRPAPGALAPRRDAAAWPAADLRFEPVRGWSGAGLETATAGWSARLADLAVELRATAAGQVGVYPEHAAHLPWLMDQIRARGGADASVEVLHLFASTGLTTLALAREGAAVVHVDSARPAIAWARRNAERNGLEDRPIRWITDDALTFARRERRRGRLYAGIVLDPPTYGHGARGASTTWSFERDLGALLEACVAILEADGFIMLTAHTEGVGMWDLEHELRSALGDRAGSLTATDVDLHARSTAILRLGVAATWDGRA